jgi:hypothetical protein
VDRRDAAAEIVLHQRCLLTAVAAALHRIAEAVSKAGAALVEAW